MGQSQIQGYGRYGPVTRSKINCRDLSTRPLPLHRRLRLRARSASSRSLPSIIRPSHLHKRIQLQVNLPLLLLTRLPPLLLLPCLLLQLALTLRGHALLLRCRLCIPRNDTQGAKSAAEGGDVEKTRAVLQEVDGLFAGGACWDDEGYRVALRDVYVAAALCDTVVKGLVTPAWQ